MTLSACASISPMQDRPLMPVYRPDVSSPGPEILRPLVASLKGYLVPSQCLASLIRCPSCFHLLASLVSWPLTTATSHAGVHHPSGPPSGPPPCPPVRVFLPFRPCAHQEQFWRLDFIRAGQVMEGHLVTCVHLTCLEAWRWLSLWGSRVQCWARKPARAGGEPLVLVLAVTS